MLKMKFATAICVAATIAIGSAAQADVFVGSFQTDDGPNWGTVPDVLSGQEAAAFLFGGVASDYRISTNSSLDENTITDTAWYTTIGIAGGQELAHDFSLDGGLPGYGAAGWAAGEDISTFVDDNAIGPQFTNFVWRITAIPEPSSMLLVTFGALGLLIRRTRA